MLHTHCHGAKCSLGAKGSLGDKIGYGIKLFAPHNSVLYKLFLRLLRLINLAHVFLHVLCLNTPSL